MACKILILEDNKDRIATFKRTLGGRFNLTFTEHAAQAIDAIFDAANVGYAFDVIFLDHDLGGDTYVDQDNTNTGSEVVRWITGDDSPPLEQPVIIIHSLNHDAAKNMLSKLEAHGFENAKIINFISLCDRYLGDPSFLS